MERKSLASDPFQPIGRYCRQIVDELRWTDDPEHRSTYLRWAVAYLTALIVIIAIFYYEGTP